MPQNTRSINYETNVNVKAFLKLIRYAEHGNESDRVYYKLYGGKREFTDTSTHPLEEPIEAWGRSQPPREPIRFLTALGMRHINEGLLQTLPLPHRTRSRSG